MAFGAKASWEGNAGYVDDPARAYHFDSFVPNSAQIQLADIVIVRDKTKILGFGRIGKLESSLGEKVHHRCPTCTITLIRRRVTVLPVFRCGNGHVFDEPADDVVDATLFMIDFSDSFIRTPRVVNAERLNLGYVNDGGQQSIRELHMKFVKQIVLEIDPTARSLFG